MSYALNQPAIQREHVYLTRPWRLFGIQRREKFKKDVFQHFRIITFLETTTSTLSSLRLMTLSHPQIFLNITECCVICKRGSCPPKFPQQRSFMYTRNNIRPKTRTLQNNSPYITVSNCFYIAKYIRVDAYSSTNLLCGDLVTKLGDDNCYGNTMINNKLLEWTQYKLLIESILLNLYGLFLVGRS